MARGRRGLKPLADQLKQAGKAMPDRLTAPEDIALYKSLVGTPDHVERVLAERGAVARRSLLEAAQEARAGSTVRVCWRCGPRSSRDRSDQPQRSPANHVDEETDFKI